MPWKLPLSSLWSSAHEGGCCCGCGETCNDACARIMSARVSREDGCRHGRNLEQDEAVDEDQENQHGELLDHLPRIDEARHDGVVMREQLGRNAKCRTCHNLVEREAKKG